MYTVFTCRTYKVSKVVDDTIVFAGDTICEALQKQIGTLQYDLATHAADHRSANTTD